MAIKKIPCGGWLYDDEQITFEDGVMKVIGGGSGGGGMVVHFSVEAASEDQAIVSADKTPAEVIAAARTGPVMGTVISPDLSLTEITPLGSVVFIDVGEPAFLLMSIADEELSYFISTEDSNWVVNVR